MHRALLLISLFTLGLRAESTQSPVGTTPIVLREGEINNLTLAYGVITTIKIEGTKPIERVAMGLPIAEYKFDEHRIDFAPKVASGATNMLIRIDGKDYAFVVQVSEDYSQVIYTRTFTLESAKADAIIADLAQLGSAPKLRPNQIDIRALARTASQAQLDPVYARTLGNFRAMQIQKPVVWNGCIVYLLDVFAFLDRDILLFRVQWTNTSGRGVYLNARQVGIRAAGKRLRAKSSKQDFADSWVMPGKTDTIWVAIQGERLGYTNDWQLELPPDGEAVRKMLTTK